MVIPALLTVLTDYDRDNDDIHVCGDAAIALGELGIRAGEKVIPALLAGLKNKNESVTYRVAETLGKISRVIPDKINFYLEQTLNNSFMPQDERATVRIVSLLLSSIH